jgi:hypothetical protein
VVIGRDFAQAAALEQTHETTKQAEQHYQVCNWDQHFRPQQKKYNFQIKMQQCNEKNRPSLDQNGAHDETSRLFAKWSV